METFHAAIDELRNALADYGECKKAHDTTSSALTVAINRLNKAQQSFDAHVDELKNTAPWNSDWHTKRREPRSITKSA